jgi:iron(III) transport system permease protein
VLLVVLANAPVAAVAMGAIVPDTEVWRHLWATRLPEMIATTVGLLVAVAAGTFMLGTGLAWLVSAYSFPGRRALSWLLVLPLAMPSYVLGFVFLALLDFPGPVQTAWRALAGPDAWFPEVRSIPGAALVLSLALYPYVYLLARGALREQAGRTLEAARVLGLSRLRAARRVVLPLARPSIAAGLALVMMETLTDFATVQYFNVQTVSVGVYRVWRGMFDRDAAGELAAVVLLFAVAVLLIERALRGRARFHQSGGRPHGLEAEQLTGWRAWAATATCAGVLLAAFGLPVLQLLAWAWQPAVRSAEPLLDPRFIGYLGNSALLAAIAAGAAVAAGLLVSHASRLSGERRVQRAAQLVTLGYAVPGPVVAVGVLLVLVALDGPVSALGLPGTRALATGTIIGVVYAYVTRFIAVGYNSVDSSFEKVPPSTTMSALTLGAVPRRVLIRVHIPLARAGIGVGLALVAIDALKELPMILLLRPFGFDTLSVWVWQLAAESRWQDAALPALVIVAAATVPVLLLFRSGDRAPSDDPQLIGLGP